jgi:hypothetical protein
MILVATTAPALAAMRFLRPLGLDRSGTWNGVVSTKGLVFDASPPIAMWTLAALVVRLRRPRPRLRRLLRTPGTSASFAALFVLVIDLFRHAFAFGVLCLDVGWAYAPMYFGAYTALEGTPADAGLAVATVWCYQAVAGCWRSEPTWIDRAGRVLGVCWLATVPLDAFTWVFYP